MVSAPDVETARRLIRQLTATSVVVMTLAACGGGNDRFPSPQPSPNASADIANEVSGPTSTTNERDASGSSQSSSPGSAVQPPDVTRTTNGPLTVSSNPRYFADRRGRPVLLVGAHTWLNFQDGGPSFPDGPRFDYEAYLDELAHHGHNHVRLWVWEQALGLPAVADEIRFGPLPYERSGPGDAVDGEARFDLDRFDQAYFDRLRQRVESAGERGLYVTVMLFNGWSLDNKGDLPGNPCAGHPFHRENNVNGVDVDVNGDGMCDEAHRLMAPDVTRYQEAYVAKVVDTVGDLDNVLYEISNESPSGSHEWQYHMIAHLDEYQAGAGVRHPVGMSVEYPDGDNSVLFESSAEWISPNADGGYRDDPPPAEGGQVVILDTDHLWGVGGDAAWIWQAVTRGHNVMYMDCYDLQDRECADAAAHRDSMFRNLGYARAFADRMDLTGAAPSTSASSSGYALVTDVGAHLVFVPGGGHVSVDLGDHGGVLSVEWLHPASGQTSTTGEVDGGGRREFDSPFPGDSVLFVHPVSE